VNIKWYRWSRNGIGKSFSFVCLCLSGLVDYNQSQRPLSLWLHNFRDIWSTAFKLLRHSTCHTHLPHLHHARFTVAVSDNGYRMSESRNNQKVPKDVDTCGFCWGSFRVQRVTGFINRHGHRDNPCSGSDKPPAAMSQPQPSHRLSKHQANVSRLHSVAQSPVFPTRISTGDCHTLCGPHWSVAHPEPHEAPTNRSAEWSVKTPTTQLETSYFTLVLWPWPSQRDMVRIGTSAPSSMLLLLLLLLLLLKMNLIKVPLSHYYCLQDHLTMSPCHVKQ